MVDASDSGTGKAKTARAPSLGRGLAILELLVESRRGHTLSEISRRLGLPKSTTHCLLITLREQEYAVCLEETGRYLLGPRFFKLSNLALQGVRLRDQASVLLRSLHEATQLTVHLAVLDHHDVILIEKVEIRTPGRTATWIGRRMEVHCTGLGKAILAYLPEKELEDQIRDHGLPKHNENTLSSPRRLRQDLEKIHAAGYAVDDEEDEIGFRCIAAPVFDRDHKVIASVSIAGTLDQITADNQIALAERAKATAAAITKLVAGY